MEGDIPGSYVLCVRPILVLPVWVAGSPLRGMMNENGTINPTLPPTGLLPSAPAFETALLVHTSSYCPLQVLKCIKLK